MVGMAQYNVVGNLHWSKKLLHSQANVRPSDIAVWKQWEIMGV